MAVKKITKRTADGRQLVRWQVRWYGDSGRQAKNFTTEAEATLFEAQRIAGSAAGTWVDPAKGNVTVRAWGEVWLAAQVVEESTRLAYRYALEQSVYPRLGDRPLRALRLSMIQTLHRDLRESHLATSTADARINILRICLAAAVRDGLLPISPAAGLRIDRSAVDPVDPRAIPTAEQVWAIYDKLPAHVREIVVVLAGTGMRPGEGLGLRTVGPDPSRAGRRLVRVDFLRQDIYVMEQLQTVPGAGPDWKKPKTRKSVRHIPAPLEAFEAINRHLLVQPLVEDEPIFRTKTGSRWRRSHFAETWRKATVDAGCPHVRTHDVRHYYASGLIAVGCDVKVVSERLGHSRVEETLQTYTHLWPDADDRTRAAASAALRRPAPADGHQAGTST